MITTTRASTSNPSNTPVTPQQLRSAGILAGLSAPLLATAAVAVAVTTRRALPGPGATSEDVIGVAAGAVLTHDVPARAVVMGMPGRVRGHVPDADLLS